ncbi:MAG: tetratricopeptide repeat protein, partial [Pseudomonadales bacterium]|nr:tetratricopeptide repeat protein [Pseudomonadales bacterium]
GGAVLAAYYAATGKLEQAEQALAQLTEQNVDPALLERTRLSLHYANANASIGREDYAAAKQHLFAALRLKPKSLRLLTMLAEVEIASANYAEAEKLAAQIGGLDAALGQQLAGSLHEARDEPDKAIEAYRQAWNNRPNELLGARLYALLEQRDPATAARFLQTWVRANPNSVAGLALRSRDLLVAGNFKAAIPLMEQVRERAPRNVTNLNNLAWAYQQVGNAQAAPVAAEAYKLAPDTAAIADTYGWILYQAGERAKAIEVLERASQLDGDNAEIAEHLAQAKAGA